MLSKTKPQKGFFYSLSWDGRWCCQLKWRRKVELTRGSPTWFRSQLVTAFRFRESCSQTFSLKERKRLQKGKYMWKQNVMQKISRKWKQRYSFELYLFLHSFIPWFLLLKIYVQHDSNLQISSRVLGKITILESGNKMKETKCHENVTFSFQNNYYLGQCNAQRLAVLK